MRAVMNETKTSRTTGWLWWGGDCDLCLGQGGFHRVKPGALPPLHPNCDCVVAEVLLPGERAARRLEELFARSRRLVREMKLVLGDSNITEREREDLLLCRKELDNILREAVQAHRVDEYFLAEIDRMLAAAERQSSRVKYRLSLEAAENAAGPLKQEAYEDRALDKADELHFRLEAAAKEFKANLRAVKAAFADEYGRSKVEGHCTR